MLPKGWLLAALLLVCLVGRVAATRYVVDTEAGVEFNVVHQSALCDPGVKQISGLLRLGKSNKQLFFWYFDSRRNPAKDPLVLWTNGGPGCSSMLGLLQENGPCLLNDNATTWWNPNGWNSRASVLFVDQPVGTGFSMGSPLATGEAQVAADLDTFLRAFVATFNKTSLPLFLFGESYAGHYLPPTAKLIYENNLAGVGPYLNLSGVGIGNGWVDPIAQYPAYPEMAWTFNNSRPKPTPPLISFEQYQHMKSKIPACVKAIQSCMRNPKNCITAANLCDGELFNPVANLGVNYYDLRGPCIYPGCYNDAPLFTYLNNPSIRLQLGIPTSDHSWSDCSNKVGFQFTAMDDLKNFAPDLKAILEYGIPVLTYNGDCDFICNWIGNQAWLRTFQWSGQTQFNAAPEVNWRDGLGTVRTYNGLTFLKIHNAGHLVPHDQPAASLEMLDDFLNGKWGLLRKVPRR